jgi:hypothetical protein
MTTLLRRPFGSGEPILVTGIVASYQRLSLTGVIVASRANGKRTSERI